MAEEEDRDITVTRIIKASHKNWSSMRGRMWNTSPIGGALTGSRQRLIRPIFVPAGSGSLRCTDRMALDYGNHIWFETVERPSLITYRHAGDEETTQTEDVQVHEPGHV